MSILVTELETLTIVSPFGDRVRNGAHEFHPGIDVRVVDTAYNLKKITAPAPMKILEIIYSAQWGHCIKAVPSAGTDLNIDQFVFWHTVPLIKEGDDVDKGAIIGIPEHGYVPEHLHFETHVNGQPIDPCKYLDSVGQAYIKL